MVIGHVPHLSEHLAILPSPIACEMGADLMIPIAFVVPAARPPVLALLLRCPLSIPYPKERGPTSRGCLSRGSVGRQCLWASFEFVAVAGAVARHGNQTNPLSIPWPLDGEGCHRAQSIPKGLCPPAQGWEPASYPGEPCQPAPNPIGVVALFANLGRNPVGVGSSRCD